MSVLLLCFAIVLLFAGHLIKVARWQQFVGIYEAIDRGTLICALAGGYIVNYFLPFHIGDLVRAFWAGRKMENGLAFSLATVIMDRCLDVWAVGLIFGFMYCGGMLQSGSGNTILFYILMAAILVLLLAVAFRFNTAFKLAARRICAIFNDRIELTLLMFFWSGITAVKDLLMRINKWKLLISTALMWLMYLLSYYTMSLSLCMAGYSVGLSDMVLLLFDSKQLNVSVAKIAQSFTSQMTLMIAVYILVPLLMLACLSWLVRRKPQKTAKEMTRIASLRLLPQAQDRDRLRFLESYFDAKDRDYLKTYIQLNQDVTILEDRSAGSNATTMLCMNEDGMFYRKYVFGVEADKLCDQVDWLERNAQEIPVPEILRKQIGPGYCCYDMPYYPTAVGLFQYLHSATVPEGWGLLEQAILNLQGTIHRQNVRPAEAPLIQQYIEKKVWANIRKIEQSHELEPLLRYETLVINGRTCRSFSELKRWLAPEKLLKVFRNDGYATIHGDLTVENIICWRREQGTSYYFIDPGTGSIHESPYLDLAKLLQSLHGGYEFLMRTNAVDVDRNEIDYLFVVSKNYSEIFLKYRQFLSEHFAPEQVRSIYYHELVHWLRLMPYKIRQNGKRAVLFFAGMMLVFNDIADWYDEVKDEGQTGDL